jgi:hypothetical protein
MGRCGYLPQSPCGERNPGRPIGPEYQWNTGHVHGFGQQGQRSRAGSHGFARGKGFIGKRLSRGRPERRRFPPIHCAAYPHPSAPLAPAEVKRAASRPNSPRHSHPIPSCRKVRPASGGEIFPSMMASLLFCVWHSRDIRGYQRSLRMRRISTQAKPDFYFFCRLLDRSTGIPLPAIAAD